MRLSREESALLDTVRAEIGSTLTPAALGWRHGVDMAGDIIHARAALMGQGLPAGWEAETQRGAQAIRPISAADFMPRLAGPDLGGAIDTATRAWLASDLRATKSDLI